MTEMGNDVDIVSNALQRQLAQLIAAAGDEQFEVGITSRFSEELQRLYGLKPRAVLQWVKTKLIDSDMEAEISAEVLRWAAHQDSESSELRNLLVDMIVTGLYSGNSIVRDTAALSLAYLEEAGAVPQVQQALERETVPELRKDLDDLISQYLLPKKTLAV